MITTIILSQLYWPSLTKCGNISKFCSMVLNLEGRAGLITMTDVHIQVEISDRPGLLVHIVTPGMKVCSLQTHIGPHKVSVLVPYM